MPLSTRVADYVLATFWCQHVHSWMQGIGFKKTFGDPSEERSQRGVIISDDDPDLPEDGSQKGFIIMQQRRP